MRKLYACSKALEGKPRLIGILSEDGGEYTFEYKLGGRLPEWFLRIAEFPELDKVYRGKEVQRFVYRIIPEQGNQYIDKFLQSARLANYDEWGLLKYCGHDNPRQDVYLYDELPMGAIVYEK